MTSMINKCIYIYTHVYVYLHGSSFGATPAPPLWEPAGGVDMGRSGRNLCAPGALRARSRGGAGAEPGRSLLQRRLVKDPGLLKALNSGMALKLKKLLAVI